MRLPENNDLLLAYQALFILGTVGEIVAISTTISYLIHMQSIGYYYFVVTDPETIATLTLFLLLSLTPCLIAIYCIQKPVTRTTIEQTINKIRKNNHE